MLIEPLKKDQVNVKENSAVDQSPVIKLAYLFQKIQVLQKLTLSVI